MTTTTITTSSDWYRQWRAINSRDWQPMS